MDDLRYRRPPKKRKGKSGLVKYGRYRRMESLNSDYRLTGNVEFAIKAMQLRKHMTKPYRVLVRVGVENLECHLSALIPIEQIEKLVKELAECRNIEQAQQMINGFTASSHMN